LHLGHIHKEGGRVNPRLKAEWVALAAEHEELVAAHLRLKKAPHDRSGHGDHMKKLHAHTARVHAFAARLHRAHTRASYGARKRKPPRQQHTVRERRR
jgi:hypothetical protein